MTKKRIASLAFALIFVLLLSGCNKTAGPEVVKMPDRCVYYVGETLDVTGGQVKIITNGEEEIIDMTSDMAAFFTDEGEGYAGTTFADQPFKTDGRKTVYLKYENGIATVSSKEDYEKSLKPKAEKKSKKVYTIDEVVESEAVKNETDEISE